MAVSEKIVCAVDKSLLVTVRSVISVRRGSYEVEIEDQNFVKVGTLTIDQEVKVGDAMNLSLKGIEYVASDW